MNGFKFPQTVTVVDHPCYGTAKVQIRCDVTARGHYLVSFRSGHLTMVHSDYLKAGK